MRLLQDAWPQGAGPGSRAASRVPASKLGQEPPVPRGCAAVGPGHTRTAAGPGLNFPQPHPNPPRCACWTATCMTQCSWKTARHLRGAWSRRRSWRRARCCTTRRRYEQACACKASRGVLWALYVQAWGRSIGHASAGAPCQGDHYCAHAVRKLRMPEAAPWIAPPHPWRCYAA